MTGVPVLVGAADATVLAAIHESAFLPAERWSATVIGLQLGAPGGFGLIDSRGGMILARVIADEAEVLTLAVAPSLRRRGAGAGLLRAAMARAAGLGARSMFLEVSVVNDGAKALYLRSGFREVGRRRRYYADGTDAIVMRISLADSVAVSSAASQQQ